MGKKMILYVVKYHLQSSTHPSCEYFTNIEAAEYRAVDIERNHYYIGQVIVEKIDTN